MHTFISEWEIEKGHIAIAIESFTSHQRIANVFLLLKKHDKARSLSAISR